MVKPTTDFFIKKMRWLETVFTDPCVSLMEARVAGVIGKFLNSKTGETFVSNETMAKLIPGRKAGLNADVRSVRRATGGLERHGYLRVDRPRGRSMANTYSMAFPQPNNRTLESGFTKENRTLESGFSRDENRTLEALKPDSGGAKTGLQSPPNLKEPISLTMKEASSARLPAPFVERPKAVRYGVSGAAAAQNNFNQVEMNRLVEFVGNACSLSTAQSWEALINLGEAGVDQLRRKMRRGQLRPGDLAGFGLVLQKQSSLIRSSQRLTDALRSFDDEGGT